MFHFLKALNITPETASQHPLYDLANKAKEKKHRETEAAILLDRKARQEAMEAEYQENFARLKAIQQSIIAQLPKEEVQKTLQEAAQRGEFQADIPVHTDKPVYFSDLFKPRWEWPAGSKEKMMSSIIDKLKEESVSPEVSWSYYCPQFNTYKKCLSTVGERPIEECMTRQCTLRARWDRLNPNK